MPDNNYDNHPLVKEVRDRLAAVDSKLADATSEEKLLQFVSNTLNTLLQDTENPVTAEFVRKMRFAEQPEPKLVGTKYARWNLTTADIEMLYDIQLSLRGQRRVDGDGAYAGPSEELTKTFQGMTDAIYLSMDDVKAIDKRALDNLFPRIPKGDIARRAWVNGQTRYPLSPSDRDLLKRGAPWDATDIYQRAMRAMDSAETGFGLQLIGAQYVGDLWEAARAESRIFALIDTFEMTDPTAFLPVEVDIPEVLFVGETTSANVNPSSFYGTVKTGSNRVQLTAKKFLIHQQWSGEIEEDSIIAFVPFLRRQAQLSIAHYSDSLVLNGDDTNAGTGNINLDDADPADTKHYLAFDGIRHVGLVDNTGNSVDLAGPVTLTALNNSRGRMIDTARLADWGHPTNAADLVHIADPETADRVALLDEVTTLDKIGPRATILSGMIGEVLGHPVIGSIAMSKTEADGKVSTTAANNTKGQIATFNRRGFKAGWRRRVKLESERIIGTDQTRLVYSFRMGFGRFTPTGAASGIESADVIYDISL